MEFWRFCLLASCVMTACEPSVVSARRLGPQASPPPDAASDSDVATYCPPGMTLHGGRLCASATEAQGPFTRAMREACAREAPTEVCESIRWPRSLAVRLRGSSDCPPGAKRLQGVCVEDGNAFGPFFKEAVEICEKSTDDRSVCSWNRWEARFASGIYSQLTRLPPLLPTVAPVRQTLPPVDQSGGPTPLCTIPRSARLATGWFNPMPGGSFAGYVGDTGLDIAGDHLDVFAVAAGTLDYSEYGHTPWTDPPDTPYSIRLRLDSPMPFSGGKRITHIWYTHMSKLQFENVAEGEVRVAGGDCLGISGLGNANAHLHIGFLLDNNLEQSDPATYLSYPEVIRVLGFSSNGERLPVP